MFSERWIQSCFCSPMQSFAVLPCEAEIARSAKNNYSNYSVFKISVHLFNIFHVCKNRQLLMSSKTFTSHTGHSAYWGLNFFHLVRHRSHFVDADRRGRWKAWVYFYCVNDWGVDGCQWTLFLQGSMCHWWGDTCAGYCAVVSDVC